MKELGQMSVVLIAFGLAVMMMPAIQSGIPVA